LAKIFHWQPKSASAAILATVFMTSENYCLSVVLFSFGEKTVLYAIFILVVLALQNNCFGIYYASRSTSVLNRACKNVMKMPTTYAAVLAFVLHLFHISVPEPIMSTLSMVGDAAIPVMMVMLGIQLGSIMGLKLNWKVV